MAPLARIAASARLLFSFDEAWVFLGPDDTEWTAAFAKDLRQAGNNKSRAARLQGLTRAQLYFRLAKYGPAEATQS